MIKKFVIFLSFLLIAGGGIAYYFWQQITALPTWYQKSDAKQNKLHLFLQNPQKISETKAKINQKIKQQITHQFQRENTDSKFDKMPNFKKDIELNLNGEDVNDLIVTTMAENLQEKPLLQSAKAMQTKIEHNRLTFEAIVNPSEIQQTSLPQKHKAVIAQLLETFPQLKNRDIYLVIAGKPTVKNGKLVFPKDSKIKVGNLSFTVEEITKKFGLSPEKVQQYLELGVSQMNFSNFQINDNDVTIKIKQP